MCSSQDIPRDGVKVGFREDQCFVCGKSNPIGFHLEFDLDRENNRATSKVTFTNDHQGWDGIVHGGILASVLDDVMAYSIMTIDRMGITTRMNVTYRKPVRVGETLYLEGTLLKITPRTAVVRGIGYTMDRDGNRVVKVETEGTYFLDKQRELKDNDIE